jgi:hypothetical protein
LALAWGSDNVGARNFLPLPVESDRLRTFWVFLRRFFSASFTSAPSISIDVSFFSSICSGSFGKISFVARRPAINELDCFCGDKLIHLIAMWAH